MSDTHDPAVIWVSPSAGKDGEGSRSRPFGDIGSAVAIVKPGMTIMLRAGVYEGNRTFDISGTIHQPLRIAAEPDAEVEIRGACWFFYDASDTIVSGLTFRGAAGGAISVIGACARNRFDSLRFVECGSGGAATCALFFGGSGGNCNVVENCSFERPDMPAPHVRNPAAKTIGIMVGEGDADGGEPNRDHVFRKNRFLNYDYGILVGTGDEPAGQYGHIVEYNSIEGCREEGILVKCGDTIVRGNRLTKCPNRAISVAAGQGSTVESNRMVDCGCGIQINGNGHTVFNNCIVRCAGVAIGVNGADEKLKRRAATEILVEANTCVDCGEEGIRIDELATAVVRRNLFSGSGRPYAGALAAATDQKQAGSLAVDNIATGGYAAMEGAAAAGVAFKDADGGDYTNDSGYGASGPVLTPEAFDPKADEIDRRDSYRIVCADTEEAAEEEGGADAFESFMGRFYSKEETKKDTE